MKLDYYFKLIVVNVITLTRIIGSILTPIYYFNYGISSFFVFICLLFVTDMLDGYLSRLFHVSTFLGSLLDSISDKLFSFATLAILAYEYYLIIFVILLEFIIFVKNVFAFSKNKNIKSSKIGKLKTVILDICISVIYLLIYNKNSNYLSFFITYQDFISYSLILIVIFIQIYTIRDYSKKFSYNLNFEKINYKKLKKVSEIFKLSIDHEFYLKQQNNNLKELIYNKDEHNV